MHSAAQPDQRYNCCHRHSRRHSPQHYGTT